MASRRRVKPKKQYSKTRSKPAKKVFFRRSLVVLLLTALSLALLCGLFFGLRYVGSLFLSRNPRFELKHIEITSDGRMICDQLLEYIGSNILSVVFGKLRAQLAELPLVESVLIDRKLPDTLAIHVIERVGVAQIQWNTRGLPFLVDRTGVVLLMTPGGQSLPMINGAKLPGIRPGDLIDDPVICHCLAILKESDNPNYGAQLSFDSFDVHQPDFITAVVNWEI